MTTVDRGIWRWPELHDGQRTVLLDVLVHGERSRAELARRTGMSRTSLSRLTRDLVELGLVEEGETTPLVGRGRPAEMLRLRQESAQFAGIKLTGEALYAVVVDLHATVVETRELALPSREPEAVVALVAEVVGDFTRRHPRLSAVGVCLAGDVHQDAGSAVVLGSHFLGWEEVPLQRMVELATGLPATIANDVQALTLAHHWFGAGVGRRSLVVIGLGAGIGAGIVVNDELVRGAHGHPGKIGHVSITDHGPRCDRGHTGCASAYVTIPAILRNAGADDFGRVLEAARAGDAAAEVALRDAAHALGVVITQLQGLIDPEKIIVTGEGLPIAEHGRGMLEQAIADRLDPASVEPILDLHPFRFQDYAWGAAISAIRHLV